MMNSLRFAVFVLLILGVHGQGNDNLNPVDNVEKGYPFGRLRLAEDGKKEELISGNPTEKPQSQQEQTKNVQPLPSPCVGARPSTKLAYPGDKTKYVQCRDEFHYEIFSCPNNGEFNEQRAVCDVITPGFDRCADEKPCLNDGQCTLLSNSTFKCTCRADWTGDRCETPINSCVQKPCGSNAECRILKTKDYEQDYVCVCHGKKGYGLNCQEVVPNPCLQGNEQYFPFAFSQHGYVQCDGEVVYFQPCGPLLYWNQEEKVCDRKRPPKLDMSAFIKKYGGDNNNDDESTTTTTTTTTTTEAPVDEERIGPHFRFVPAKVPSRQQGLFAQNQQQTQPDGINSAPQEPQSTSNQWSSRPWSHTPSKPIQQTQQFGNHRWHDQAPRTDSWQNQQQFQDQNEETTTTTTTTTTTQTTVTLPSSKGRNFQSWQTQPTNQWNNNQAVPSQSWQSVGGQQPVFTTTPSTFSGQSWQNQPNNQWNTNQGAQSWQTGQGVGAQQPVFTTTPSTVSGQSWQNQPNNQWNSNQGVPSQTWQQQPTNQWNNNQGVPSQSWQTQPTNQWNTNQGAQSWQTGQGVGTQQPVFTTTPSTVNGQQWQNQWNSNQGVNSQSWQTGQGVGGQQSLFTTTPSPINGQSWQNQWNTNQGVQSQPWQSKSSITQQPITLSTTTTTTPPPSSTVNASSWQDQRSNQAPQSFQDQAQFDFETTTTTTTQSNVVLAPNQSWQTQSSNQWNTNGNSQTIGFQPQQMMNRPSTQSWQNYQTVSTQQPILPLTTTTTTPQTNVLQGNQWNNNQISNTMGLTQQRGAFPIQKSFDQAPSWSQNNINTQSVINQRQTPDTGYWSNHAQ